MATSKKIQGALALSPPTEEEAIDYNAQMKNLMGQLVQNPDEQRKGELLAWGGGLSDPGGNGSLGGALINATKSQSEYQLKDRQLRAQYIPMIMTALAQQQQTAQLARMTGAGGLGSDKSWIGMPIDTVYQISQLPNQDLSKNLALWKAANHPDPIQAGSYINTPLKEGGFHRELLADPKNPFTINTAGERVPITGGIEGEAALAGAQEGAKTEAQKQFAIEEGVTPGGTAYKIPFKQAYPQLFPSSRVPMGGPTPPMPMGGTQAPPSGMAPGMAPAGGGAAPMAGQPAPIPVQRPAVAGMAGPRNSAAIDQTQWRGAFEGNPQAVAQAISNIRDPIQRQQAMAGYENQLRDKNPPYVPDGAEMPANQGPAAGGTAPVANAAGLPPGAIQTGMEPMKKQSLETVAAANQLFLSKDGDYAKALADGRTASNTLPAISQSRTALKALNTGAGGEFQAAAANVLGTLGIPQAKEYAANSQIFQQAASDKLLTKLETQIGVQTEGDADRAKKTFASLKNQPKANAFILDMAQAQAERDKMRADYYAKALPFAQQKGDLQEINRRWMAIMPSIYKMPSMKRWDTKE